MSSGMLRLAALLLIAAGGPGGASLAQQQQQPPPRCSHDEWDKRLRAGLWPPFVGCRATEVREWMRLRSLPAPELIPRPADDVPIDIVLAQSPAAESPRSPAWRNPSLTISSAPEPSIPTPSIAAASAVEGDILLFQVAIARREAWGETYRFGYVVRPGSARQGQDFEPAEGELVFGPGQDILPVNVVTRRDGDDSGERTLTLAILSDGVEVATGSGTIIDQPPDPAPRVAVRDATAVEGEKLRFRVAIARPAAAGTSYRYRYFVAPGSAREGVDYRVGAERALLFGPGETEHWIEVETLTDGDADGERTLTILVVGDADEAFRATGTISDADSASGDDAWTREEMLALAAVGLGALLLAAALLAARRYWRDARETSAPPAAPLPEAHCSLLDGDPPAVEGGALPFAAPVTQIDVATGPGTVDPPGPLPILE